MNFPRLLRVTLAVMPAAFSFSAAAHHGQAGLFEEDRTVEITGQVREWLFVNPHPVLVLEVTSASGERVEWDIYFGPAAVSALTRRGFSPATFAAGETLIVKGHPAAAAGAHGVDVWGAQSQVTRADGSAVP